MVARAASQAGRPLPRSQPRSGWTQITRTRARKLGAMMPEIALSPNVAIVAAASPDRINRARGMIVGTGCTCSLTRRTPRVSGPTSPASVAEGGARIGDVTGGVGEPVVPPEVGEASRLLQGGGCRWLVSR